MSPSIEQHPFVELLRIDPELAAIRAEYARRPSDQRRMAADLAYHQAEAGRMFGLGGGDPWQGHVVALATDPGFAPAILTVGTLEYELGRPAEAKALLDTLHGLPADTEDLPVALDKAATYLGQRGEHEAALAFFRKALARFPRDAALLKGPSWCLGHLGRHDEAVIDARRAAALCPDDPEMQADLGWCLVEAGQIEEAVGLLERAVARWPEHELARGNLEEARRRLGGRSGSTEAGGEADRKGSRGKGFRSQGKAGRKVGRR
ncbi:MAG: tetratricopeptide repeat protein [Pseudomonadota bacterium]